MTQEVRSDPGGLEPGEQLAGYLIQEEIGRGGMAVVYRALDLRLDRLVALKVLAPHLGEDEAFRQRFMRESRAAAGVDHPHIIPVFEAGEADGVLFIAMRYVSRGDVRWLIRTEGRLTAARTVPIVGQVASALDAAHAYGLVHRDVKPGNILLGQASDESDHAYLSDFGLSKHSLNTATLTAAGQFLGTLDYVSPEQIQGQPVDGRADQYALACTVMEMLTGAPPFRSDDSMALMWAQLETDPPRLTQLRPDLPPAVDQVMRTAMAKSPSGRFASCRDFAMALSSACLRGSGSLQTGRPAHPADSHRVGGPHDHGEPRQAGDARDAGAPRQHWDEPRLQGEQAGRGAAVAGDAARALDTRRQDRWQPEPSPVAGTSQPPGGSRAAPPVADSARPAPVPAAATKWDGHVPADVDRPHPAAPDWRPPQLGHEAAEPLGPPHLAGGRYGAGQPDTRPHQPEDASWGRGAGGRGTVQGRGRLSAREHLSGRGKGRRSVVLIAVIAVVCAVLVGGIAYELADRHTPTTSSAAGRSGGTAQANPAATVKAYFAAINEHRFLRAWELVGERGSFKTFAAGFAGTEHDTVKIVSVKGDVVTATLTATQQDGSAKTYSGTYTVTNGVIESANVQELS